MKCNLLFELWTFLRLDVVYGEVMRRMPGPIHWLMWQVATEASKRDLLTSQKKPTSSKSDLSHMEALCGAELSKLKT